MMNGISPIREIFVYQFSLSAKLSGLQVFILISFNMTGWPSAARDGEPDILGIHGVNSSAYILQPSHTAIEVSVKTSLSFW